MNVLYLLGIVLAILFTIFGIIVGIAINPGANAIGAYIDRFMDWNVPVITFNTDVVDSKRLFYVGHDTAQSGRLGGELMGKMLGGKGGCGKI